MVHLEGNLGMDVRKVTLLLGCLTELPREPKISPLQRMIQLPPVYPQEGGRVGPRRDGSPPGTHFSAPTSPSMAIS